MDFPNANQGRGGAAMSRGAAAAGSMEGRGGLEFLPGKLPGNQYAFKNMLYVNPQDF